jgi:hypothetical protein
MVMLLEMPLYYNQNILMDRKPIFIKTWYDKGIRLIKDIMNVNGTFLDRNKLEAR